MIVMLIIEVSSIHRPGNTLQFDLLHDMYTMILEIISPSLLLLLLILLGLSLIIIIFYRLSLASLFLRLSSYS